MGNISSQRVCKNPMTRQFPFRSRSCVCTSIYAPTAMCTSYPNGMSSALGLFRRALGKTNCGRALTGHRADTKKTEIHLCGDHTVCQLGKAGNINNNIVYLCPKLDMCVCRRMCWKHTPEIISRRGKTGELTETLTLHQFISYYLNLI